MYFVDREKIEKTLSYLESLTNLLEQHGKWESAIEKHSLERIGQLMIESILDVGNAMIDGFIMRDPGSYDDIIDILEDERVVKSEDSLSLKKIISFRRMLVQEYISVDHEELLKQFKTELPSIKAFPDAVRDYLHNELGPVSAFKNESLL
jgi:uncharacterized protein YutE (UPF0331/DUF86 family)